MASVFPAEIIKCRACGARDVEVIDRARAEPVVSCYRCGTALWTWSEFLHRVGTIHDSRPPAVFAAERSTVENPRAS